MDFFEAQELRRKKTKWLVLLYAAAIVGIIVSIYIVVAIALGSYGEGEAPLFQPWLFAAVAGFNLLVIGAASLFKLVEMRGGGAHIAAQMGGTLVAPTTTDMGERRLLNVVEEMALAAGVSVPPVYILNGEPGINAFAAGYSPADAVIGVNRGTVDQLNRDELQGVIAHEFSHVLNGDMRLNIRLISVLFGLQMLSMIGYFLLRSMGSGGHRRSSGDKDKGGAGAILAIALALFVFGAIGKFFAQLIKASVSRQREYLADASAVQFTRYPDGIGGALKVIGASATGSKVVSHEADELSHMFFASCFSNSFASFFATHPPLVPRIQKVDQDFDGDFQGYIKTRQRMAQARAERKRRESQQRKKLDQMNPIGGLFPADIAGRFSIDPAILLAAIGEPESQDVTRSRVIMKSLPICVRDAARDPYSARCVAFAMLASDASELRKQQLDLLSKNEGAATVDSLLKLLPEISQLPLVARLPLMELIQGSLAALSPQQYKRFRNTVQGLVQLDNKTSLFEFVVRHHLLMHLDRRFNVSQPPRVRYKHPVRVKQEIELMLSAFASASVTGNQMEHKVELASDSVLMAYRVAMQVVGFGDAAQSKAELQSWEVEQLESCMLKLHCASPTLKKQFLHAAAALITFDHEITIAEAEFFRAVAESLDCPVPMLAAGRIAETPKEASSESAS